MAAPDHGPTETSPLLPKQTDSAAAGLEPSAGIVPDSVATDYVSETVPRGGEADERALSGRDGDGDGDGDDLRFEGMPEIRKKMKYIFPALAVGVFLAAADQTIIVSSYGKIGSDLDALNKTSWIATAYFLTLTSFQPLYGKLSDIFTRKSCLLFSYVVFGIGQLLCGLSQTIDQLICARAFAGIGGAGMTTVVSILLSDVIPLRERGTWQGYINIIYAAGAGTGVSLGGVFADAGNQGWRWAFLFQAPLCLAAVVAVGLVLKESQPPQEPGEAPHGGVSAAIAEHGAASGDADVKARPGKPNWKAKLRRIDFLGAATLVAAVLALLIGLDRGSNDAWTSLACLLPLCLSPPLFGLFLLVEMKVAEEPFAPGHLIFDRSLFACYLCNYFSFAGWLAALFYIPLYLQVVQGASATRAGLLLVPSTLAGVSGSLFAGWHMRRTGRYFAITAGCYAGLAAGLLGVLLAAGAAGAAWSSTAALVACMCLCAFSNGTGVTSTLIGLISNTAHADRAVATACSYLFRSLGSTTGVSLSASVFNQLLRSSLARALDGDADTDEIIDRVRRSLEYVRTLEPATREAVVRCYGIAIRGAFILEIGLVAGAALAAWGIREKPLSR